MGWRQTETGPQPRGGEWDDDSNYSARPAPGRSARSAPRNGQTRPGQLDTGLSRRRAGGRRTATSRRPLQRDAHPERPQETDTITVEARSNPLDLPARGRMPQSAQQTARELFARRQPTRQSGPAKDQNCPGKERQGRMAVIRRTPTVMQCEMVPAQDLNLNHLFTVNQS